MEEVNERKKQEKIVSNITQYIGTRMITVCPWKEPPLSYFPWGQSSPRRDESGKLMARRRPNGRVQSQVTCTIDHTPLVGLYVTYIVVSEYCGSD